jgi:hypothetical protein
LQNYCSASEQERIRRVLLALRWDAVDFGHGQIHISRAKNGTASDPPPG